MEESCKNLPEECWEMIINRLDDHHQWESLSLVSKKFLSITNHSKRSLKVINPSTEVLSKQLQRFPCLNKIDLSDFSGSLQNALLQIASSGLKIQELNISGKSNPPIDLLKKLSSKLKNVRVLVCSESYLNNNDLKGISVYFPSLEVLDISSPRFQYITDEGIISLSKNLKHLQKIDLEGNHKISHQSVISLISNCKNLKEIVLRFCYNVSQAGISFAMEKGHSLSSLILGTNTFHQFEFSKTLHLSKTISTIDLYEIKVSDAALRQIIKADLPLKSFHLTRCKSFTLTGIYALLNVYQSLESLTLDSVDFLTDESVTHISQFIRKLSSIKLDGCFNLTASSFIAISSACPVLEHINMSSSRLSSGNSNPNSASAIIKRPSIRSASLKGHTLSQVLHICQNLKVLTVYNSFDSCEVDIDIILQCCSELRELTIVSDDKLKFSGKGKEESCKLAKLNAQKSLGMNDQVLKMVGKRCPKLVYLNLEGCRNITESGLKGIVQNCRELRHVNLDWCIKVSRSFVSWMIKSSRSLRKVVCMNPCDYTEEEQETFLRQGCIVLPGTWEEDYYW